MMLATAKGKIRGKCPECRTEVWLTADELGEELGCNVCGTSFRVQRRRERRYVPGYWKLRGYPLQEFAVSPPARRPLRYSWLKALLLFLAIALLFLALGGSPADEDYFPLRLLRWVERLLGR